MSRAATEQRTDQRRPVAVLSRSTLMTVRRVLHAFREGWLLEERLATAARMAAEDARGRRLEAAEMLVALKREWAALDEVRRLPMHDARDLMSRLVTLSIRAYYTRDRGTGRSGGLTERTGPGGAPTAA